MKYVKLQLSMFLLAVVVLFAAFFRMGWDFLESNPIKTAVDTTMPGYVLIQNGQSVPCEVSISGHYSDYMMNGRSSDHYLVDVQIGQFTCSDIYWVPVEKDYEMSSCGYEDLDFLVAHDLSMILISMDYSLIDSSCPSTPCLVICSADSKEDALALLQDLDDWDLPESWDRYWEDHLP